MSRFPNKEGHLRRTEQRRAKGKPCEKWRRKARLSQTTHLQRSRSSLPNSSSNYPAALFIIETLFPSPMLQWFSGRAWKMRVDRLQLFVILLLSGCCCCCCGGSAASSACKSYDENPRNGGKTSPTSKKVVCSNMELHQVLPPDSFPNRTVTLWVCMRCTLLSFYFGWWHTRPISHLIDFVLSNCFSWYLLLRKVIISPFILNW